MQGSSTMEGEELEEMKISSKMHGDVDYASSGKTYKLLGIEPVEGKDCYKIEVTDKNGDKSSQWYDVASNLQVKSMQVREMDEEQGGGSMTIVSTFSDYKEVSGVKYAHKISQSFGPQALDMEVTSIEVNSKLGDDVFQQ